MTSKSPPLPKQRRVACVSLLLLVLIGCATNAPREQSSSPTAEEVPVYTGAEPWETLPAAPRIRGKQDDVYFLTAELGWSVNGEGSIFKTKDSGESWERVWHQPGTFFRAIIFVDSLRGFAGNIGPGYFPGVVDSIPLCDTRDGGRTWRPVESITGPFPTGICNFHRAPDGTLWAAGRVGGPSYLLSSKDAGETWTSRDLSEQIAMLIDVRFADAEHGIIVGGSVADLRSSHSVILSTADRGETWTEIFRSSAPMELAWKIDFPSPRVGYVSVLSYGPTSTFLKSTDGGRSWDELPFTGGPYQAKGVGFLTEEIGWIAGERPGFPGYRTVDGGRSWAEDKSLEPLINRFRFVRDDRGLVEVGYAIGMTIQRFPLREAKVAPQLSGRAGP